MFSVSLEGRRLLRPLRMSGARQICRVERSREIIQKGLFHDRCNDGEKSKKQKNASPFPVELIDQLLAQVENKDDESILGESAWPRNSRRGWPNACCRPS